MEMLTGEVLRQYSKSVVSYLGTGPLACLSLFPVAELDEVSNGLGNEV